MPDRVKPSFVRFDIWALLTTTSGHSDAQGWASECPDVKNHKWWFNRICHRMLYCCTHMETVGVKGLIDRWYKNGRCVIRTVCNLFPVCALISSYCGLHGVRWRCTGSGSGSGIIARSADSVYQWNHRAKVHCASAYINRWVAQGLRYNSQFMTNSPKQSVEYWSRDDLHDLRLSAIE